MSERLRVAFVIQRYGTHVLGGAEQGCRQLAEALSSLDDLEVEVLSTTAKQATTWAHEFPEGTSTENGVKVHRFRVVKPRAPGFGEYDAELASRPKQVSPEEMERWVDDEGPVTPGLIAHLDEHRDDYDVFVFYTYLYWPAIRGVPLLGDKALLMPAAHDEPPIYLPVFKDVFESAGGLVFQTPEERDLAHRVFDLDGRSEAITGLGVVEGRGNADRFRSEHGMEKPFLLYLGRVEEGKGVVALYDYFTAYKERRPDSDLALVFAGPQFAEFPEHPDVLVLGAVSEETKWDALSAATALVNPSPFESFSIVIMESWYCGRPVLVYEGCGPTTGHCRRSGGGLWFKRYGDFEGALDTLLGDHELADALGRHGEAYVRSKFTWPIVRDKYAHFLRSYVSDHRA